MAKVPSSYQFLFPSSQVSTLDSTVDKIYIVESLLRNATLEAWQWLLQNYTKEEVATVVKTSTSLSKKDVRFWSILLTISPKDIACLQTKSQAGLNSSWAY